MPKLLLKYPSLRRFTRWIAASSTPSTKSWRKGRNCSCPCRKVIPFSLPLFDDVHLTIPSFYFRALALWFRWARIRDVSTGLLPRPFARSLAPLTQLLASLARSAALICSLARSLCSLPSSWESVWFYVSESGCFESQCSGTGSTMRKVTKENDIFSELEMHFKIWKLPQKAQ